MTSCPIPETNPAGKSVTPETEPTVSAQRASIILNLLNNASDNPVNPDVLRKLIQELTYRRELAHMVSINPKQGSSRVNVLIRQLQSMLGQQDLKSINRFFSEARARGENLFTAVPLLADDLAVSVSRLEFTRQVGEAWSRFKQLSKGVPLKKQRELFTDMVEVMSLKRLEYSESLGPIGRKVINKEFTRVIEKAKNLGISKGTFDEMVRTLGKVNSVADNTLTISKALGLDIGSVPGIGYMPRILTPDAKRRLTNARAKSILDELDPPKEGNINPTKGRQTFDFTIRDQYRAAEVLLDEKPQGLPVSRWRQNLDYWEEKVNRLTQEAAKVRETNVGRAAEIIDSRNNLNNKVEAEIAVEKKRVETEVSNELKRIREQYASTVSDLYNKRQGGLITEEQFQRRLQKYTDKRAQVEARALKRGVEDTKRAEKSVYEKYESEYKRYKSELDKLDREYEQAVLKQREAEFKQKERQDKFFQQYEEPLNKLAELLDDEGRLNTTLLKLPIEELMKLSDEGILDAIPMTSARVFEYITKRYELPYQELGELLIDDPVKAFSHYTERLQSSFRNSAVAYNGIRAALEKGWGITPAQFADNQMLYKDWLPVSDILNTLKLDSKALGFDGVENIRLSPQVVEPMLAYLDLATDVTKLSMLGEVWKTYTRIMRRSLMTSSAFVFRNFIGSAIQMISAGANLLEFPRAAKAYVDFMMKGAEGLDNTRKVFAGGTMTLREVMLKAKASGRVSLHSFTGDFFSPLNQEGLRNRVMWAVRNLGKGRIIDSLGDVGKGIDELTRRVFTAVLLPTMVFEDLAQLTTLFSVLRDGVGARVGNLMTGGSTRHYTFFEDAVRHIDSYFINYSDTTKFDGFMSNFVSDFYIFTSRNLAMQFRNLYRYPWRFAAWSRLYKLWNEDAEEAGEDLPRAGIADYLQEGPGVYFRGRGNNWFVLPTGGIDPVAQLMDMIGDGLDGEMTDRERVERALGEGRPGWMDFLINSSNSILRTAVALVTEEDPFTGRDLTQETTFLGFEVPEVMGLGPGVVRYALENSIPYVSSINRSNPGELFGVSEIRDARGNVVREGRPSIFGYRRLDRDSMITGHDGEAVPVLRVAKMLGLTIIPQDVEVNMQGSYLFYSGARSRFRELKSKYEKKLEELGPEGDARTRVNFESRIDFYDRAAQEMDAVLVDIESWLNLRGLQTPRQKEEIKKLERRLNIMETLRGIKDEFGD